MSRIAKRIIKIPKEVSVVKDNLGEFDCWYFLGPKGKSNELVVSSSKVEIKQEDNEMVTIASSIKNIPLAGTYNSLLKGLIIGVSEGYQLKMEIRGVGYKIDLKNQCLSLSVGKSHSVFLPIPKELEVIVSSSKRDVLIKGIDKQEVTSFASKLRSIKKPSAYHNKGIFYLGELTKLKPTKSASKK